MERPSPFIREPGSTDVANAHPSKPAAENVLVAYVRARPAVNGDHLHPDHDQAVASYFEDSETIYAIARVMPLAQLGIDQ